MCYTFSRAPRIKWHDSKIREFSRPEESPDISQKDSIIFRKASSSGFIPKHIACILFQIMIRVFHSRIRFGKQSSPSLGMLVRHSMLNIRSSMQRYLFLGIKRLKNLFKMYGQLRIKRLSDTSSSFSRQHLFLHQERHLPQKQKKHLSSRRTILLFQIRIFISKETLRQKNDSMEMEQMVRAGCQYLLEWLRLQSHTALGRKFFFQDLALDPFRIDEERL